MTTTTLRSVHRGMAALLQSSVEKLGWTCQKETSLLINEQFLTHGALTKSADEMRSSSGRWRHMRPLPVITGHANCSCCSSVQLQSLPFSVQQWWFPEDWIHAVTATFRCKYWLCPNRHWKLGTQYWYIRLPFCYNCYINWEHWEKCNLNFSFLRFEIINLLFQIRISTSGERRMRMCC